MPCTSTSIEPHSEPSREATASIVSSRVTSHSRTSVPDRVAASSSTIDLSRSPAKVMQREAPAAWSCCAMAHERLRWLATPMTRACLPLRSIETMRLLSPGGGSGAGEPPPLPHPDGQDDDLDAGVLQPALDRERRLVVE